MGTRELARWVSEMSFDDLPSEVVLQAKRVVFDCLGASIFTGSKKEWGKVIADFALRYGGLHEEATVITTGKKTLAAQAALANGTMAEGFELGDVHADTSTRPFPMLVPAALALCEARKRDGKTLLAAIVAGYEVNIRIGMAIHTTQRGRPILGRGFYLPSLIGTFAGAAAAGKSIGLDPQKMSWALGIAGSLTGGYFQGHEEGAWTRRLNGGIAPSRGVEAALLAEGGFVGPEEPLEGEYGFYRVFANNEYDLPVLSDGLGASYKIMETWFKAYPMNATLHGPAEALLAILTEEGLSHGDIKRITAGWHQYVTILSKKDVHQIVSAQFSLPFALAVASVRRKVTVEEFTPETIEDPTVRSMLDKIEVVYEPSLFERVGRSSLPGSVTIETNDGRTFNREVLYPKGHPRNPMSLEEMRAKFAVLTDGALTRGEQDALYETVMSLDSAPDISQLMKQCAVHPVPV